MGRFRRRCLHPQAGQATVEFALILFPLLWLLIGAFDLGRGVLYQNMAANAAREGSRRGIGAAPTGWTISNWMCNGAHSAMRLPGLPAPSSVPTATHCGSVGGGLTLTPSPQYSGGSQCMKVQYVYGPVTPMVTALMPSGSVTLSGYSCMAVQG